MLAANHAEQFGIMTLDYPIFMTIEEYLEMLAVTIVIAGLLSHIAKHLHGGRSEIEFA
jgi:hypothetical protein